MKLDKTKNLHQTLIICNRAPHINTRITTLIVGSLLNTNDHTKRIIFACQFTKPAKKSIKNSIVPKNYIKPELCVTDIYGKYEVIFHTFSTGHI